MTKGQKMVLAGGAAVFGGSLVYWLLQRRAASLSTAQPPSGSTGDVSVQATLAQDSRIPFRVRRYAMEVSQAAPVSAPSEIGVEQWARVMLAIADRESNGDPTAVGDGGFAHGLMQINDKFWPTFAALPLDQKFDPLTNLTYGGKILRSAYDQFAGTLGPVAALRAAVAAYNEGAGNVRAQLASGQPVDARTTGGDYSADVLKRYISAGGLIDAAGALA